MNDQKDKKPRKCQSQKFCGFLSFCSLIERNCHFGYILVPGNLTVGKCVYSQFSRALDYGKYHSIPPRLLLRTHRTHTKNANVVSYLSAHLLKLSSNRKRVFVTLHWFTRWYRPLVSDLLGHGHGHGHGIFTLATHQTQASTAENGPVHDISPEHFAWIICFKQCATSSNLKRRIGHMRSDVLDTWEATYWTHQRAQVWACKSLGLNFVTDLIHKRIRVFIRVSQYWLHVITWTHGPHILPNVF
jgi:hypothetical protein